MANAIEFRHSPRFDFARMHLTTALITAAQTQPLRHAFLWPHLASASDCVLAADGLSSTFHMGCFSSGELVGIATLVAQHWDALPDARPAEPQMRLRAMATHINCRGHNVGSVIIKAVLGELYTCKKDWVWCDARVSAIGFYDRVGWSVDSKVYEVEHVGRHQRAFRRIVVPV